MKSGLIAFALVSLSVGSSACTKTTTVYVTDTSSMQESDSSFRSVEPIDPRATDGRYSNNETDFYQFVNKNTRADELMTSEEVIKFGYFSCEKMSEGLDLADLVGYSGDAAASLGLEADYSFKNSWAAITGGSMTYLCPEFLPAETTSPPLDKESLFVDAVRSFAPSPQMNLMSDREILENGYGVCGKLRDGSFSVRQMFQGIVQSAASQDHLAALTAILSYGIDYLCSEFTYERDEVIRNP